MADRLPRTIAIIAGIGILFSGVYAMAAPRTFYDRLATFEPYNQHFIQDIGAFMIGLAAVLLLAAFVSSDALAVALLGVGIGSVAHTVSHVIGQDLGGTPARDIPLWIVISAVLLIAGARQARRA